MTSLYDRLLEIPMRKLDKHFENFVSFVEDNNPICIISKKEYNLYNFDYNNSQTINYNIDANNNNKELNSNFRERETENDTEIMTSFDKEKSEVC